VCCTADDHNGDPVDPTDDPPGDGPGERAWVAPEAPAEPVAPTPTPAPAAEPAPERPAPVPLPLRPMTMADLLDGGFTVLRIQPRTVLTLAAAFIVPLQLVVAFLQRDLLDDLEELFEKAANNPNLGRTQTLGSTSAGLVSTIGSSIVLVLLAAALAKVVTAWYSGQTPSAGEVLRSVAKVTPALLVAWFFVHLLELVGAFLLFFPALLVMTAYLVTAPAIAVEGLGPFQGMARASRLARRRFWPLMGIGLVSGLISSVLTSVLALVPQALAFVIGPERGWLVFGIGGIVADLVARSFVAGTTVLAYLDLRIRTEGLDLAYAAERELPV
jgi:hypothetical protein